MFKELVDCLIEENFCLIDIVGRYFQVTKQLDDYTVSVDDRAIYLIKEDDKYVINYSEVSLTKDQNDDCFAYHLNYRDESEIYIAFPLLENI